MYKEKFKFDIQHQPDFSFLTVRIPANTTLKVEASAMATMDTNIKMKTRLKGGLGRLFTGESLFVNEFTAQNGDGEITIAPSTPGDMRHIYLDNEILYLQNSAFVASDPALNIDAKFQGLIKGLFSGESMFLMKVSGTGDLWFNSYGGIVEIDVNGEYIVDTGHIVAFTQNLGFQITKLGGYQSFFFSGEGFVCKFNGIGKVWVQTRKINPLLSFLNSFRPSKG